MKLKQFIIVLAMILGFFNIIFACFYYEYASVCDAYNSAEAIFVGTVVKIVKVDNLKTVKLPSGDGKARIVNYDGYKHYIKVEKTYKGLPQTEIHLASYKSTCDRIFEVGDELLLYVKFNKEIKMWEISVGSRNNALEMANDDLIFLNGLPKTLNRTRVSGNLISLNKTSESLTNLSGTKVKIQSRTKIFEVTSDQNGVYEIYDLPSDSYTVTPEIPIGLMFEKAFYRGFKRVKSNLSKTDNSETLNLRYNKCVSIDFLFRSSQLN